MFDNCTIVYTILLNFKIIEYTVLILSRPVIANKRFQIISAVSDNFDNHLWTVFIFFLIIYLIPYLKYYNDDIANDVLNDCFFRRRLLGRKDFDEDKND